MTPRRHGSYGIDAPYAPAFMAVMTVVVLVMAILSGRWQRFVPVTFMLAVLGLYLHNTLRGKFVVWARLLDQLHLRGDERILDLGCGRGAVLLMAAQHLTTGRAVGVDLWRSVDQSGNSLEATRRNAIAEGVADRVELHTGDMTALPFEDNSFDVLFGGRRWLLNFRFSGLVAVTTHQDCHPSRRRATSLIPSMEQLRTGPGASVCALV